ncbi:ketoacyl-ACP synthase III [Massilia forsythiae]|uniref:Ketoacyl-ACP synthase III n=1 Tax=Massilia forsythiae TaxID=2728020 RepID=A0A7Z2VU23_9BURK|nr:ketoacyl-ACP synthase III [Massilia forsythiae]QJD99016.1 ketoacyl-ACP synthase III [Massilia forsythiae]
MMAPLTGVAIRGVSTAVPGTVARTADYTPLTEAERVKFAAGTGIEQRRVAAPGQCASDLCIAAAADLLARLDWDKSGIGALVMITQTGDHPVPATAIIVQHKLGLPTSCAAFDINLGCSSYPYGLAVLGSTMRTLGIRRALLLVGDVSTRLCSYNDKSSWPLFGDAGSATALELDDGASPIHFDLNSDGAGKDAIIVEAGGLASKRPAADAGFDEVALAPGMARHPSHLRLQGADIFSFAIGAVPPSIRRVLAAAGWELDRVEHVVLHQANKMINDFIRKKVGYPQDREIGTLRDYGNTSSVSIPLTLCAGSTRLAQGGRVLLSGFGVGLSWASATLVLDPGIVLRLFDSDHVY